MCKTHAIGYFSKNQCETIEDTTNFREYFKFTPNWLDDDLSILSNEAARHMWEHKDGWEWMGEGANITLVKDGKTELGDFDIKVYFEPIFYTSYVKPNETD